MTSALLLLAVSHTFMDCVYAFHAFAIRQHLGR